LAKPVMVAFCPAAIVMAPPCVTLTYEAGPVWLTIALLWTVAPLRTAPPVRAKVPGPRRKPPMTVAPFSVAVAASAAANVPKLRLKDRADEGVPANSNVPSPLTVMVALRPRGLSVVVWTVAAVTVRLGNEFGPLPGGR